MSTIRPVGTGGAAMAAPFLRTLASPRAALVLTTGAPLPTDWPEGLDGSAEANLSHALGWTCEVRRASIVLLNPLGEGHLNAPLPELGDDWLANVRHDGSAALYLAPTRHQGEFPELTLAAAAQAGELRAATVRTGVADDYGRAEPVGRNEPCPCGSGRKYKHCHG
ncbi:MAG: SEC-C domain-containing protein [Acidimicrobiia bacterium]|nr:SEC-C domain-containing protein [Acidimicrobiia bacterium]